MAATQNTALPFETPISQLGFTPEELATFSPGINRLTKGDLISLTQNTDQTVAALNLSVNELNGLKSVVVNRLQTTGGGPVKTGGGGSGDGGIRCCCCIACCCCCCAVSVEQSSAVA